MGRKLEIAVCLRKFEVLKLEISKVMVTGEKKASR